ncbi:MAG TPA: carboxypeptidase-like regulatory domain-containing protein [Polyangiaceae bacterium]|nr:carboxypeptidase-like regulatory domain-containing protein [Polyangiaceae bacterium]
MRLQRLLLLVASGFALPILALACSSAPENPGDPCEPDGDPCPSGTSCLANKDGDTVCLIDAGGSCDKSADDPLCAPSLVCDAGTGTDDKAVCRVPPGAKCDPTLDDPYCTGDNVCAEKASGDYACFPPVYVEGRVFDASTDAGIEKAQVLGLDDQATAITDVAISGADGAYKLNLPVARNDDGTPIEITFTLRSSAQDYLTFPSGLRTSLPIKTTGATTDDTGAYIIKLPLTDISLIPLADADKGRPSISGTVLADDQSGGVLVVAEAGTDPGITAISDKKGLYTIFNVPAGDYTVNGYAAGVSLKPASAKVADKPLTGVDLSASGDALGAISGNVQIVNAPGGSLTSVVLVVESTFNDTFVRGEVPRGLRAPLSGPPSVSGAWSIKDVPPGKYVVLAGFENDGLVRDPDPNIAGTQIVHIEMPSPGSNIDLADSFKITEALAVISPGKDDPEGVSGTPTFKWADDSSEDYYSIVVYDAYGSLVWENQMVPKVTGGDVSVTYAGPALEKGMYYQFRATSWRQSGGQPPGPISQTEDLKGVFFAQ